VEVRWRSLFRSSSLDKRCTYYNAPPTSRKRAADRWSLRNFLLRSSLFMVGKAQKWHGARSGLYGGCSNGVPPIHVSQAEHRIQFRSRPMRSLGFSNHEKGAPTKEISKWSTVCSKFSRRGWSVVRSASLTNGGIWKRDRHRTSTKFRLGAIMWVYKLSKRPSYYSQDNLLTCNARVWIQHVKKTLTHLWFVSGGVHCIRRCAAEIVAYLCIRESQSMFLYKVAELGPI
jgi:hypothetical protein